MSFNVVGQRHRSFGRYRTNSWFIYHRTQCHPSGNSTDYQLPSSNIDRSNAANIGAINGPLMCLFSWRSSPTVILYQRGSYASQRECVFASPPFQPPPIFTQVPGNVDLENFLPILHQCAALVEHFFVRRPLYHVNTDRNAFNRREKNH